MGGSPLNNEVWSAKDLRLSPDLPAGAIEGRKPIWWTIKWTRHFSLETVTPANGESYQRTNLPFMPRAGAMVASQPVLERRTYWGDNWDGDESTDHPQQLGEGVFNLTVVAEYLYVMGGFGAWYQDDPRYDGERARNDVWRTSNGDDWIRLDTLEHEERAERQVPPDHSVVSGVPRGYRRRQVAGAPWSARAFGTLVSRSLLSGASPRVAVEWRGWADRKHGLLERLRARPHPPARAPPFAIGDVERGYQLQ